MTHQNPSREILQQRADWAEAALLSAKLEIDDLRRFQEQLIAVGKKAQIRDQEEITRLDAELAALKAKPADAKWVRELKWVKIESVDQIPVGSVVYTDDGFSLTVRSREGYYCLLDRAVCILALPHEIPPMPEGTP